MQVTKPIDQAVLSPDEKRHERLQIIAQELGCYTVADMEALTDQTAVTLARMRNKGQGPEFITFGRTTLYPKESVHQYIRCNLGQRSSKSRPQRRKADAMHPVQPFADGLAGKAGKAQA